VIENTTSGTLHQQCTHLNAPSCVHGVHLLCSLFVAVDALAHFAVSHTSISGVLTSGNCIMSVADWLAVHH
jgi:hypothetical protein